MTISAPTESSAVLLALRVAVDRRGAWSERDRALAALDVLVLDDPVAPAVEHLGAVAEVFGLGQLDERVLLTALLAELHPAAHLLCGLLSGDSVPARPTVALALELAGASVVDAAARDRVGPDGPLARLGLIALDGDDVLLARRLRLPDRVVARLLGSPRLAPEVASVLVDANPVDLDGYRDVAAALTAGEPLVWVHSPVGAAGTALAVAACRDVDVTCLVADLERLPAAGGPAPDPAQVHRTVRALVLEAGLGGSVLVLAGAHLAADQLGELDSAVPVVAVGRTGWDPRWSAQLPPEVTAARLSQDERAAEWHRVVGRDATTRDVLTLRMTPEEITAVGRRAEADAVRAGRAATSDDVRLAARRLSSTRDPRLRTSGSQATLDDLVLPTHTRREVERLIGWARDRDEVMALGDLQGKGGKGTGITALFSGSPGTGKTLAAHVVADSLGLDLFRVDLSSVVDKYIGETEKNLERVFTQAEALNAVLFFDEADALFGSRSSVSDARDRYANQEVSYLLQRMEASEGITVLATNLRGNLDPAFARRLHFMVHFPDPDEPTRRLLWQHHLAQLPGTDPDDPVDVPFLAGTLDVAGGDIRNIVLAAAYDAVAEHRQVGMRDLRAATVRELTKLGRRAGDARWSGDQPG
ncbi:ATP-binding protein [Actinotalea sp. M2MS4P-6]|uniref:AAA family ATPase n=1 Tax=Actinotalea sp. M2MS4P-6 TaxID=2983762 RepID=UPI0021E39FCE|nr:ATP-binding protein [Actinotalea sp. M2MS4P-6]MCV2395178.1 ATP-binding protein [Actinotalea sp. M2MS4P-6]